MGVDTKKTESFIKRWSRVKAEALSAPPVPAPAPAAPTAAPPELPPLDALTPESDFSVFLHPKVDEGLRRAALKKLFADPRFNQMDGLDVYIDDYGVADPIPEEMLRKLNQYQSLLAREEESRKPEPAAQTQATVAAEPRAALPEPAAQPPAAPDSLDPKTA